MAFPKTFLQGMEPVTLTKTLDRCNLSPVSLHGKHQARSGRLSVKKHSTGATGSMLAANMSPGEIELFSQKITKVLTDFDVFRVTFPIDLN